MPDTPAFTRLAAPATLLPGTPQPATRQVPPPTAPRAWLMGLALAATTALAQPPAAPAPQAPAAATGASAAPAPAPVANPADAIVVLNVKGAQWAGIALTKSLDGQLRIKPANDNKRGVAALAMVDDVFNGKAAAGARQQYYNSQDPELLETLWQQAAGRIAALGMPIGQLRWDAQALAMRVVGNRLDTEGVQVVFGLHPRVDMPLLKPLIDRGELLVLAEVSAIGAMNELRAEKQRVAELKRKGEERTQNLLARLPTFGDSLVSLVLPAQRDGDKVLERRYCTIKAAGDMGAWSTGFRYLDKLNKGLNTKRDSRFDELAKDLDELYGQVQTGKCQVLITSNDDAAKLAAAMQRDKIAFSVHIIIPKPDLLNSYAESKGYPSHEKYELAQQLVPNATVTARGLERLEALGVSSLAEFNAVVERMTKSKYATERTTDNVLAYLADEKEGQAAKQTAVQVRDARDRKAAADRRAAEEAEKAQRAAHAKEYPFYAVISCGMPNHINILACFSRSNGVDTELKVKNGNDSQMYKVYNLRNAGKEERDGLHIDLRERFSIAAQNSSDSLILTVKIYDRMTGKVVYNDQAAKFGMVRVGN
ncbi:hypothetical protein [Roseateles sp. BYS87W]|uniref:Uncharacterized protein n=1 Tax=Pelomonas baiyunensis TaxID=3299026 RepID=A0ABW7H1C8_9BURK